jgi:hypothetical protein
MCVGEGALSGRGGGARVQPGNQGLGGGLHSKLKVYKTRNSENSSVDQNATLESKFSASKNEVETERL